ncbi:iron permease FTR1/Fip1/EfeU [Trichophaea hybrida]|nr:iron permease FTR1/Fip1/EfeU [Trichophaea hybrida]
MGKNVFSAPVFFIVFRETIETSIIVAILLSFVRQTLDNDVEIHRRLVRQVWLGTFTAAMICLIVGCGLIGAFYGLKKDLWSGTEDLYEGIFSVLAAIIITLMGFALLRINKMQEKWKGKITDAMAAQPTVGGGSFKNYARKYAMFILPFLTVLREGLEAIVFVGGVSLSEPASAFPIPAITGLLAGALVGWLVYKWGNKTALQWFLIGSTCLLYLVASGLLSKAAWSFDMYQFAKLVGGDVAETGAGPGSYNIHRSVWHVNCCSPKVGGGAEWGVFNSVLGWQNSATYSSVITYNLYWIAVIGWVVVMRFEETHGRYPLMKAKTAAVASSAASKKPVEETRQKHAADPEVAEVSE